MAPNEPTRRPRLLGGAVLAGAVAVAAAVTVYLFASSGDDAPAASPFQPGTTATVETNTDLGMLSPARPEVGEPAPDFALIDARTGAVRKLSDFRGTPVLINWYASWCGPCKDEIPEFAAMIAAVGAENITVVGIDYQESAETALEALRDNGGDYAALLDSSGSVADHYRVGNRLPSSFFIDAEGVLRAFRIGQVRAEDLAEQLQTIGITYEPAE